MKILIYFLINTVLAIIVGIVVWVKGNRDMYRENRQDTSLKPDNKEIKTQRDTTSKLDNKETKTQNVLVYKSGGEEYKARFENGTVYSLPKYTDEYVIGYYAYEDGEWKVRCQSDKGEIGSISKSDSSALIYFNRLGDLARYKNTLKKLAEDNPWLTEEEQERQYNNAARNTQLSWYCAEIFSDFILDVSSQDVIATSNSQDVIGNAAAFICLQYEVVMEGKYHGFFKALN